MIHEILLGQDRKALKKYRIIDVLYIHLLLPNRDVIWY